MWDECSKIVFYKAFYLEYTKVTCVIYTCNIHVGLRVSKLQLDNKAMRDNQTNNKGQGKKYHTVCKL